MSTIRSFHSNTNSVNSLSHILPCSIEEYHTTETVINSSNSYFTLIKNILSQWVKDWTLNKYTHLTPVNIFWVCHQLYYEGLVINFRGIPSIQYVLQYIKPQTLLRNFSCLVSLNSGFPICRNLYRFPQVCDFATDFNKVPWDSIYMWSSLEDLYTFIRCWT